MTCALALHSCDRPLNLQSKDIRNFSTKQLKHMLNFRAISDRHDDAGSTTRLCSHYEHCIVWVHYNHYRVWGYKLLNSWGHGEDLMVEQGLWCINLSLCPRRSLGSQCLPLSYFLTTSRNSTFERSGFVLVLLRSCLRQKQKRLCSGCKKCCINIPDRHYWKHS